MKASTVRGHARILRRNCEGADVRGLVVTTRDAVPDHVPNFDRVVVSDLPRLTIARIGAISACERLEGSLREWIDEGGPT